MRLTRVDVLYILVKNYCDNMSIKTISEKMGLNINTVRRYVTKHKNLKDTILKFGEENPKLVKTGYKRFIGSKKADKFSVNNIEKPDTKKFAQSVYNDIEAFCKKNLFCCICGGDREKCVNTMLDFYASKVYNEYNGFVRHTKLMTEENLWTKEQIMRYIKNGGKDHILSDDTFFYFETGKYIEFKEKEYLKKFVKKIGYIISQNKIYDCKKVVKNFGQTYESYKKTPEYKKNEVSYSTFYPVALKCWQESYAKKCPVFNPDIKRR